MLEMRPLHPALKWLDRLAALLAGKPKIAFRNFQLHHVYQ